MRLQTIRTEKLFGIFNHVIHLNTDDRITIIHGPNGYGKTAILRLISDVFESRHTAVRELPFETIELTFDDDSTLVVRKADAVDEEHGKNVVYECSPHPAFSLSENASRDVEIHSIEHYLPMLTRSGPEEWIIDDTGEILVLDEVVDRFGPHLPGLVAGVSFPDWFKNLRDSLDVHFIRATRLESSRASRRPVRRKRRRRSSSVVAKYAEELADHIRGTLAEYAELSQSLDRSFPRRLVTAAAESAMSMEDIKRRLVELEQKRKQLTDTGLLDKEAESHFDVSSIDQTKAEALSLYIADVEKKLAVFDSLYARIDLLKTILNRRFTFKAVSIDKNDGIEFQTDDAATLAPEYLSSGEQHEVVLLYQLLFKVKANSLILIDEPELSLHIAWQEQFVNDLAQITTLSSFDALIATHSPQIIGDRWNLTVELTGPNGCAKTLPTTQSLTR